MFPPWFQKIIAMAALSCILFPDIKQIRLEMILRQKWRQRKSATTDSLQYDNKNHKFNDASRLYDLTWSNLAGSDRTWPDLTCPYLTWPDPIWSDLTRSDLTWSLLTRSDLTEPDLTCLPVYPSVCLFVCLSVRLSVCVCPCCDACGNSCRSVIIARDFEVGAWLQSHLHIEVINNSVLKT